ncbi:MAG: hypothetical protein WEE64_09070 [Dehalococcoidia bacterium]
MLTPFDDYPIHQTAETLDRAATSDRNFYDRYYFSCFDLKSEVFLVVALGVFPNIGVIDAFATATQGDAQWVVRASRALGHDRAATNAGPIHIEVLEGLRRLRVACEPNEWGLDFDLTFEGAHFPFQEPHFFRRAGNRVVMDYTRLTQVGRWEGTLTVGDKRYDVTPEAFWGARDRSWGIRPVGDREPASAPSGDGRMGGFYWNWAPVQFDDSAILYSVSEETDGRRWHEIAVRAFPYESEREPEQLRVVRHDIKMKPGTRVFDGGSLTLEGPDGRELVIEARPQRLLFMQGAGYAYTSGWRGGQYHGPLVVEGERWDLNDPNAVERVHVQTETVCEYRVGDKVGYGPFELIVLGAYEPDGFKTPFDVPS